MEGNSLLGKACTDMAAIGKFVVLHVPFFNRGQMSYAPVDLIFWV